MPGKAQPARSKHILSIGKSGAWCFLCVLWVLLLLACSLLPSRAQGQKSEITLGRTLQGVAPKGLGSREFGSRWPANETPLLISQNPAKQSPVPRGSSARDDDDEDEHATSQQKFVTIPVTYMTDRDLIEDEKVFGNRRNSEATSIYDVYCGTVNVTIENFKKKSINNLRDSLGWKDVEKKEKPSIEFLDGKEEPYRKLDRFGEEVSTIAKKSGQKEVCVFIHGFNNTFEVAATRAARIAYVMERPVILYSWPSRAKVLQYIVDSGNNEWSQEHFNRFVEKLHDVKVSDGIVPVIIAHSMGNRLVVRSAPVLENKQLFEKVFLVDPDFDSQTFLHYMARYANHRVLMDHGKVRILFSHKDNALPVAQKLAGGYTRLGQGAGTILESFLNPKNMLPSQLIQNGKNIFDKDNFNFLNILGADRKDGAAATLFAKQLEWIDFTVLDYGMLGHSVPYQLIANLSKHASPGVGLKLVEDKVAVATLKSKVLKPFFGKKTLHDRNPFNLGICKRVEFVDENGKAAAQADIANNDDDSSPH